MQSSIEEQIALDDKVVIRVMFRGTHLGLYSGVPPTGKVVEVMALILWRFEEGKVVENWTVADQFGLFQQLGVLPATLLGAQIPAPPGKEAMRNTNAVLVATPEYNGAVPEVLADAIDWASRPTGQSVLRNKPVAVMGAVLGRSGSANAQAALRGALNRIGAIVVPDSQVLVPHASRLFDEQVNLRDEDIREEIRQLVEAVAHWCRRVQPKESNNVVSAIRSSSQ